MKESSSPGSCYCCVRMLAEQETSSAAASSRPARRIEITAEGSKVASIPIQEIGEAGEALLPIGFDQYAPEGGCREDPPVRWMRKWEEER